MTLFGEGQTVARWAHKVGPARQAVKTSRRISSVSFVGLATAVPTALAKKTPEKT